MWSGIRLNIRGRNSVMFALFVWKGINCCCPAVLFELPVASYTKALEMCRLLDPVQTVVGVLLKECVWLSFVGSFQKCGSWIAEGLKRNISWLDTSWKAWLCSQTTLTTHAFRTIFDFFHKDSAVWIVGIHQLSAAPLAALEVVH